MTIKKAIFTSSVAAATAVMLSPAFLAGQAQGGLDPASIRKPLADTWPTYSGDYTGRRYSSLKQINQTTVKNLTLAWTARLTAGDPADVAASAAPPRHRSSSAVKAPGSSPAETTPR